MLDPICERIAPELRLRVGARGRRHSVERRFKGGVMTRSNDDQSRSRRRGTVCDCGVGRGNGPRGRHLRGSGPGRQCSAEADGEPAADAQGHARDQASVGEGGEAEGGPRTESRRPRTAIPFRHLQPGPPAFGPRPRAARAHDCGSHEPARHLPPGSERGIPPLRDQRVGDHVARSRPAPSGDQDLPRHRHHRPHRDDPRRPEPARLPRLGPVCPRRVVHRPVPRRSQPERPLELLRTAREGHARPLRGARVLDLRALRRQGLLPRRGHGFPSRRRLR